MNSLVIKLRILSYVLFCFRQVLARSEICSVSSLCQLCRPDEITAKYCLRTGRRVELTCRETSDSTPIIRHRSCNRTAQDDLLYFFEFQVAMFIIGLSAFYISQRRKLRHQSLYDQRSRRGSIKQNNNSSIIRNDCL
mmetsp:Transcript_11892/g.16109  ORF Transcript_11892/g.16109 Transcript_11892/m.16109 type:complete len:137 (+) Transcript_11892:201-611(+)